MAASAAVVLASPAGRRAARAVLILAAAFLLLLLIILGGIVGGSANSGTFAPTEVAIADIPGNYLTWYQRAATRYNIDWAILAAVGKIECDHGRFEAPGCNPPGTVNRVGATGPMQFLGSTWRIGTSARSVPAVGVPTATTQNGYATDGDGDGIADVWNPADAIAAASRYLQANGAPANYRRAIFAYNPVASYVEAVLAKAREYRGAFAPGASQGALGVLSWAVAHVGSFTYSQGPSTDRGGTVTDMRAREPSGTSCDCSMFTRWAFAQAGIDIGLTTVQQWPANGLLSDAETTGENQYVLRGVGSEPPAGGYEPADLIFFGHGSGGEGHVALWLGDGLIVQCSASGNGSNVRPLAGYAAPTGWVRWRLISDAVRLSDPVARR